MLSKHDRALPRKLAWDDCANLSLLFGDIAWNLGGAAIATRPRQRCGPFTPKPSLNDFNRERGNYSATAADDGPTLGLSLDTR